MTLIPFIVAAVVLLALAAYLLATGFMLTFGSLQFGSRTGVVMGIVFMLAGGVIGHMGVKVAPINITIERTK